MAIFRALTCQKKKKEEENFLLKFINPWNLKVWKKLTQATKTPTFPQSVQEKKVRLPFTCSFSASSHPIPITSGTSRKIQPLSWALPGSQQSSTYSASAWSLHFPQEPQQEAPLRKKPQILNQPKVGAGWGRHRIQFFTGKETSKSPSLAQTSITELVFLLGFKAWPSHTGSLPGSSFHLEAAAQAGSLPFDLVGTGVLQICLY